MVRYDPVYCEHTLVICSIIMLNHERRRSRQKWSEGLVHSAENVAEGSGHVDKVHLHLSLPLGLHFPA